MTNTTDTTVFTSLGQIITGWYKRVLNMIGITAKQADPSIKLHTDLCLAQTERRERYYRDKSLPDALMQAFSVLPLAAGDARFIGREEQLSRVSAIIKMWREGHSSMLAVTGPQGSGLSSFLRQLEPTVDTLSYHELSRRPCDINDTLGIVSEIVGLEETAASVDALLESINQLPPSVFVIDNGHFLSCRMMGAHSAIRIFGSVMVATQQRHLWILGCEEFAWRRLTYIYRADRFFTDHIQLSMFSESELDQCLALRQQVSGVVLNSVKGDSEKDVSVESESEFPTLYKMSTGKPDLAFFYYLGRLQRNEENKLLEMQRGLALDFSALKNLIREELFTLAEVSVHGSMTIKDHCALFRSSHEESWLLLERLYQQCLLDKDEGAEEPGYRLVPVYSEVINRFLTNTNYLY